MDATAEAHPPRTAGVAGPGSASADASPIATPSTISSAPRSREGSSSPSRATTTITTTQTGHGAEASTTSTTKVTHVGAASIQHELRRDGSLAIRPVAAKSKTGSGRRIAVRKVVTFRERTSAFDRYNPESQQDPFRGFYTLFWVMLAFGVARTLHVGYAASGELVQLGFARMFSEDARVLAATDAVLVGSTFACVPFVKMIQRGWIRYRWTGLVVQHTAQALWLSVWIRWTFYRQWPWVQSGFLTLHSISMLMKIHSYCATNGDLSIKHDVAAKGLKKLSGLVEGSHGGWGAVVRAAEDVKAAEPPASPARHEPGGEPEAPAGPSSPAAQDLVSRGRASDGEGLHRRKGAAAKAEAISTTSSSTASPVSSGNDPPNVVAARLLLVGAYHPDAELSALARTVGEAMEDLTSTVDGHVTWPENITYANYWDYLLVPSLVYELAYPRKKNIRPLYILEKSVATLGTFSLIVILTQYYVWDVYPQPGESFIDAFTKLILPFMTNYILIFYIIFECICNAFAEFTRFADREFYSDWWNSTSFDEFARKWNKPVHNFLLRHVYASSISTWGLSRSQAALITFSLSAMMHELLMAVVTKKVRLYLFAMQMAQLPLIAVGQLRFFKQHPALGNLCFWLGLMSGFPLLGVCYILY